MVSYGIQGNAVLYSNLKLFSDGLKIKVFGGMSVFYPNFTQSQDYHYNYE